MSTPAAPWSERLLVLLQACLPTRALSRAVHAVAHWRSPSLKNTLIRLFIRRFGVDMRDAEQPTPESYPHFNAFFTRALRSGARPIPADQQAVISPVDGSLSQLGRISDGQLIQAKGMPYSAAALLGEPADAFRDGAFCTIYLAPYDYHRIHAPMELRLRGHRHLPGRLFSVNPATARARPALFARNERVVAHFDCQDGQLAVVMVGALLVGSVDTVWAGRICPPHRRRATPFVAAEGHYPRGAEIGRFNMGSTVILLATPGLLDWREGLAPGQSLRMGQAIGSLSGEP